MQFKHFILPTIILISSFFLSGCLPKVSNLQPTEENPVASATPSTGISNPESTEAPPFTPFTATFEIYTLGTKRIFTDSRYHQQSSSVYLLSTDPATVHVAEAGVTWADFFASLPMSLDAECLITGTKQTFCTNQQHTLVFTLNGNEEPDALQKGIKAGDFLEVQYR